LYRYAVRAIVIPLPARAPAAVRMHQVAKRILNGEFPPAGGARGGGDSVWYQDPGIYHFSVFHTSHHLDAHAASAAEAKEEAAAIRAVARASCAIEAVVERVVVTSSGVVVGLSLTPEGVRLVTWTIYWLSSIEPGFVIN
jgi:hypothetical protein